MDKFTIEAVDLGQVYKIRIRHDNSMMAADWYLDQVEVMDEDTEEVYMFMCERWLSKKKEDKSIDRIFFVQVCKNWGCGESSMLLNVSSTSCCGKRMHEQEMCLFVPCLTQGYEGERNSDPYAKKMAQAKLGLDRNANKKKKKKKAKVAGEGPSKTEPSYFSGQCIPVYVIYYYELYIVAIKSSLFVLPIITSSIISQRALQSHNAIVPKTVFKILSKPKPFRTH